MAFQDLTEGVISSGELSDVKFKGFQMYDPKGSDFVKLDFSDFKLNGMIGVEEQGASIAMEVSDSLDQAPKSYSLQVSGDGCNWIDLGEFLTKSGNLKKRYKHDKLLRDLSRTYGKEYIEHLKGGKKSE